MLYMVHDKTLHSFSYTSASKRFHTHFSPIAQRTSVPASSCNVSYYSCLLPQWKSGRYLASISSASQKGVSESVTFKKKKLLLRTK